MATPINWSKNVKYSGITINYKLIAGPLIKAIVKRDTQRRGILYPVLNRNSAIPLNSRLRLWKMYVLPIMTSRHRISMEKTGSGPNTGP